MKRPGNSAKLYFILVLFVIVKFSSARDLSTPLMLADSLLADSMLAKAYQNEALYTLQGGLKPMSTVYQFRMELDSITMQPVDSSDIDRFRDLQRVAQWLSNDRFVFVVVPFTRLFQNERTMQMLVISRESFMAGISRNHDFWIYWGLVPESSPEVVVTVVENAEKYRRFEGYGYLFGYPQYAIDFFVEAARSQDETGEFVERSFFQLPVFSKQGGRFVYAVPKDVTPSEEDLTIRLQAETILNEFIREFEPFKGENTNMPFLNWYLKGDL